MFPGLEVPGWYVLQLDRHAEGLGVMADEESGALGGHLRSLTRAIEETTGTDTVYATCFGEYNRHLHVLVAGRPADVPAEQRRGRLLEQAPRLRDPERARRTRERVRAVLGGRG